MAERFDAIILGAGQGGAPLASALAEAGLKTALIERGPLGGTCVNTGCTPSKTMIASARAAYLARRAGELGVHTGEVKVDLAKVVARKRAVVEGFRHGAERGLSKKLELIRASGRFVEPRTIRAGDRTLTAEKVFIDTGTRPAEVRLEGIESVQVHDSTSIMELEQLPEHLFVLGGGVVGLEMAQLFRRLGSKVTIIERGVRLLDREDADVSDAVNELFMREDIEVYLGTTPIDVFPGAKGGIEMEIEGEGTLHGSHLLAAVGRTPNTDDLGLDAAGVKTGERGYITVNERLETSAAGVWALGDVIGGPAFTHRSYDHFRVLEENVLGKGGATTRGRLMPYVVYTDPQLGRIGMTETEAHAARRRVGVKRVSAGEISRAAEIGETHGMLKSVVDLDTEEILGAAIFAPEGGELMASIQVAMLGKLPYTALRDAAFAHPSWAEALNTLFTISKMDAE